MRDEMIKELKVGIAKEMSKNKVVGLSIAIVDTGGVLLSEGFGKADKENNISANSSTLFPIASVTKTFTGIAVMQLVEKGLIDLDKPIVNYIPELSLPGGEEKIITPRMLLTHHSGIHGDILYNWYLPTVSTNPLIYKQIIDLVNEAGTIFPPGKLHSYSNAGYSLLGIIVHRVSGIGYVDYIRSNIFEPLQMKSSIVFAGEPTNKIVAKGYFGKKGTTMPMGLGIPAGGIAVTADDAAKYLQGVIGSYHGNNKLLSQKTMQQMMSQQNKDIPLDKGFSIGLSWFLQDPINHVTKYAAHRGELPPYYSMMIILPELKIGLFLCVNTNSAADFPDELAHSLVYDLCKYHTGKPVPQVKERETIAISRDKLKQYEGIYPNVYFGPMVAKLKGKNLTLKSSAMPGTLVLTPHADSTFSIKVKMLGIKLPVKMLDDLKVEFRENKEEKYMYFVIHQSMLNPNLRISPFKIPKAYKNYSGKYKVINMENSERVVKNVTIKLSKDKRFYIFKYTFLGRHKFNMVIQPIDGENAKFAGTGYFVGDKIRWEKIDDKIYMFWSGLKLEKL
jgi:CubicO group peptidase (beta-lactamase class C family)